MNKDNVVQTRLRNGLKVHLKEIRTAPLVSCWIWYQVGSRNERPGGTGLSHWVEHMQFKETTKIPTGVMDRAVNRMGASLRAATWIDWTTYYETLPSDQIDLALDFESDRMTNSIYESEVVKSERTVIISERQGRENEPSFRLSEEVRAAAFRVHSYHHQVLGDLADLHTITRDDLHAHYRRYYNPSNAVLAIAGDFRTSILLKKIRKYFGSIPSGEKPGFISREEPRQLGEKRITVEGPGETPLVEIAYHIPEGDHKDFITLTILASILTGASSPSVFGGRLSNRSSRLYRKLVEGELTAAVSGSLVATIDPFLYSIYAVVRSDRDPDEVVDVISEEIDKLMQDKVNVSDVNKAIKQARALFAYGSESISQQAYWLGYPQMFADYSWFETYLDRVSEVNSENILEVAKKYLIPQNRIVGIYRPVGGDIQG
jgi:zinc protease